MNVFQEVKILLKNDPETSLLTQKELQYKRNQD